METEKQIEFVEVLANDFNLPKADHFKDELSVEEEDFIDIKRWMEDE